MDFKVGELYYHPIQGICCITKIYSSLDLEIGRNIIIPGSIGSYQKFHDRFGVYSLYKDQKFQPATDEHIIEYLNMKMGYMDLGSDSDITVYNDSVVIYANNEAIYLNKKQVLALKEVLNREII